MVGLTSESRELHSGGGSGCDRLGRPVPRLTGDTCVCVLGGVPIVMVVAGWVAPTSGPLLECSGANICGLAWVLPRPPDARIGY